MKKLAELFGSSSRELKSVRTITVCAMLAAAAIILVNFRIELTNTQRIGFSGIPNQLVAYLFGPAVSCLFAGALDIIKYLIKPVGAFFPGLTLVTMLAGLIYGFFFYKKPLKLTRVLAAHFLVCLVCNVILNTLCLSILYGQAFMILLPPRVIQNIVKWPIDSFIFFNVAKMLEMSGVFRVVRGSRAAVQRVKHLTRAERDRHWLSLSVYSKMPSGFRYEPVPGAFCCQVVRAGQNSP